MIVRNNRIDLALHRLRDTAGDEGATAPPLRCCCCTGSASGRPRRCPTTSAAWPGPVWALDFTGHGCSTVPSGGGYFCELLMSDVDAALGHLGPATLYGRGLGAYVALLTAGARPDLVRGAVLDDGPGLAGGGHRADDAVRARSAARARARPTPTPCWSSATTSGPPDYAATYARQAATLSGLDTAIVVSAVVRPPWLAAVAAEPGVRTLPRARALTPFLPA